MTDAENSTFWADCPLIHSDGVIVHREVVFLGTRLPARAVFKNFDAFMEADGLSEQEAIEPLFHAFQPYRAALKTFALS